jgi:glycosyltransferase involved in cell wall biosynthesis
LTSAEAADSTQLAPVDLVMPVYNEGPNIALALERIAAEIPIPKRLLVVYDFEEDDTLPILRSLASRYPWATAQKNNLGKGVINAVRAGFAAATADVVVVTMADLSDDLAIVPEMVRRIRQEGFDIVCASRYMKGGRQIGGPKLKGMLSRLAGVTLYTFAGLPTHDATNAFRAYRRTLLERIPIESQGGFEYTLELTVKAHAMGYKITELPATWHDRSAGRSRFRLLRWLPQYLKWYAYALTHRPPRDSVVRPSHPLQ